MKILVSPGFGAGWSTWCHSSDPEVTKFMLTYKPFIAFLEGGGQLTEPTGVGGKHFYEYEVFDADPDTNQVDASDIVRQFVKDFKNKFPNEDTPFLGGIEDLEVRNVTGPFRIREYDGSESVEEGYNAFMEPWE